MAIGRWAAWNTGLAGLLGAAGVALAATAAHRVGEPTLATASQFLILHGAAVLGLTALGDRAAPSPALLTSASIMIFAVALFSGDLAARALVGDRLFPFAAPVGGTLLIVSWLFAALAGFSAAVARRRS